MSFKQLHLAASYDTGLSSIDVISDFYNPLLSESVRYDRVAGYFSSRVIASAARGIAALVRNNGKMRLITSHAFTPKDVAAIQDYYVSEDFSNSLLKEFTDTFIELDSLSSAMAQDHVGAMCWMLREGYLEIKVVVPKGANLSKLSPEEIEKFHPKYGILMDGEGNTVSFAGSINETESAWSRNIENLDLYVSWFPEEFERRIKPKIALFEKLWAGESGKNWDVIELPAAVKDKLIRDYSPEDFPKSLEGQFPNKPNLRDYQIEAVNAWESNHLRGILSMATGTGKTRTAKSCIELAQTKGTLLTVVVVPYQHIGDQWMSELSEHRPVFVGGDRAELLARLETDFLFQRIRQATLVVVKETAGKPDFISALISLSQEVENLLIVADEVHWLGANAYRPILDNIFNFRLGLSATPKRYFDDEGTDLLINYFSGVVFDFPISKALKTTDEKGQPILCPYEYHPEFVDLDEDERKDYKELSRKIAKAKSIEQTYDVRAYLESLYLARAKIAKSASAKLPHLKNLLTQLGPDIKHCLIYCSDTDQLSQAADILRDLRISAQRITGEESTNSSPRWNGMNQREFIIDNFANGRFSVLLAIRCLDEGVDIPAAETGIILASSGNSKEFIQRRGRLMRPFPGKQRAVVYDLCVIPDKTLGQEFPTLRATELNRIRQFAEDALNREEVEKLIQLIEKE